MKVPKLVYSFELQNRYFEARDANNIPKNVQSLRNDDLELCDFEFAFHVIEKANDDDIVFWFRAGAFRSDIHIVIAPSEEIALGYFNLEEVLKS